MPIIDVQAHIGSGDTPTHVRSLEQLDGILNRFGIEVVMFAARAPDFVAANDQLFADIEPLKSAQAYVAVNAHYPDLSLEQMKTYLPNARCCGLYAAPGDTACPLDAPAMVDLLNASRRYGKPCLVKVDDDLDPAILAATADAFATLKFIACCIGDRTWEPLLLTCEEKLNVCVVPGGVRAERDRVRMAVDAVGPRRVLYGSNMTTQSPAFAAGMVLDSGVDDATKERILYSNAKSVFGL